jgi:hypothetical protein
MEFTTKTTEQDYVAAYRLRFKPFLTVFNAAFFVLFALLLYFCAVVFIDYPNNPWNYFFAFMLPCLLGFRMYIPYRVRRIYRTGLNQQGEAVNELTSEGISKKSSEGSLLYFPWAVCSRWRESRRVIIVIAQFGICLVYPKTSLTTAQQDELRSILAAHLPKK